MENWKNGAVIVERRDETYLCDCPMGEALRAELESLEKHEIIVRISELIGPSPVNLHIAEEIFELLRFDMARFVLHHDYRWEPGIRTKLLLWLDTMVNPQKAEKVSSFFKKYLK